MLRCPELRRKQANQTIYYPPVEVYGDNLDMWAAKICDAQRTCAFVRQDISCMEEQYTFTALPEGITS